MDPPVNVGHVIHAEHCANAAIIVADTIAGNGPSTLGVDLVRDGHLLQIHTEVTRGQRANSKVFVHDNAEGHSEVISGVNNPYIVVMVVGSGIKFNGFASLKSEFVVHYDVMEWWVSIFLVRFSNSRVFLT